MAHDAEPPFRIVAPTDGSESSVAACRLAVDLVGPGRLDVLVLTVFPFGSEPHSASLVEEEDPRRPEADRTIDTAIEQDTSEARRVFEDAGHLVEVTHRFGNPPEEIIAAIEERQPHLVVMGRRGRRPAARFFLGSVSDKVLRSTHTPLLVAP